MVATDLSDLVSILRFTGHYFNFDGMKRPKLLRKLQKVRLLIMISCNPLCLSSLFIGGLKNSIGIEAFFAIIGFLTAVQHAYAYSHRSETEAIIRSIVHIRSQFQKGTDRQFIDDGKNVWMFVRLYFFVMSFLLIAYIIIPKIADYLVGIFFDHPTAYLLPMSMNGFLDKNQPRNMKYLFVTVLSVAWACISSCSRVGYDSLLSVVGTYYSSLSQTFCRQLRTQLLKPGLTSKQTTAIIKKFAAQQQVLHRVSLHELLSHLKVASDLDVTLFPINDVNNTDENSGDEDDTNINHLPATIMNSEVEINFCESEGNRLDFGESADENNDIPSKAKDDGTHYFYSFWTQPAKIHDNCINLTLRIRSLFGFPYALQNLLGSFCICSLLYGLLSDTSNNTLVLAANLFNLMFLFGMLSCTAYMGQHITDESSSIFEALYDLPWFELCPSDRKYFVSMIAAARDPFTIHYHGRGALDLKNFMMILNTSYSYLMFLKSSL